MDSEPKSRREFLRLSGAAALLTAFQGGKAVSPPSNVLILKSDEHNPRISSLEGHPFVQTPNLERLARRGMVFDAHYCPSPLCVPSRSAFISGKRVHEIQTYNNCCVFKFDYPSYGRVLDEAGVHTVFFGKLDVYNWPDRLGFSEMYGTGTRDPGDTNIQRRPLAVREDGAARQYGYGVRENPFRGDEQNVDRALSWLRSQATRMDRPWTLELNIVKPHFPHYVDKELWQMYEAHADLPRYGPDVEPARHPFARDLREHFQTASFTSESIRGLRRGYYGCVTFVDRQLGRVLDVLDETGLSSNTVVVYTSDHGEMLGEFGMWWKCSLYEDSARVPLVVAGPGFPEGKRIGTAVDQLDLTATLFRATGKDQPRTWRGTPLQEIDNSSKHTAFCEYHGHGTRASAFMVRRGPWKYIYNYGVQHQLFNLKEDPHELHNRVAEEREVAREMEQELREICHPEQEQRRAEEFIQKELRALAKVPAGRTTVDGTRYRIHAPTRTLGRTP
jgi:choline-sulfatase